MRRRLVAAPMAVGVMLAGTLALVPGTAKASVTAGLGLRDAETMSATSQGDANADDAAKLPQAVATGHCESALSAEEADSAPVPGGSQDEPSEQREGVGPEGKPSVSPTNSDGEQACSPAGSESEKGASLEGDGEAVVSGENGFEESTEKDGSVVSDGLTEEKGDEFSKEADLEQHDGQGALLEDGGVVPEGEADSDVDDDTGSDVVTAPKDDMLFETVLITEAVNEPVSEEAQLAQSEVATLSAAAAETLAAQSQVANVQLYRLYNPNSGEHLYTSDTNERDTLRRLGWVYEGEAWVSPSTSQTVTYRLYNPNSGDHHFTTDKHEYDVLGSIGWKQEGLAWYGAASDGIALFRLFNPNVSVGTHHFTSSVLERLRMVSDGWRYEGIAWYGVDLGPVAPTNATPNTWVDNGGSRFYIGSNGAAVTGWQTIGGTKYHFDNKGRMSTGVTDVDGTIYSFSSSGTLNTAWQKLSGYWYYFDNSTGALRRDGWFVDGGKTYYLDPTSGAMATGTRWIDGYLRPFDSSGACLKTGYQTKWGNLMLAARNVTLPGYAQGSYWSYVHPCTIGADATRAQVIEAFINAAYDYQRAGTRWVDNNCGAPGTTVDCSGLVMESLYAVGMDLTGVAGGDFNPYSKYYWNHHFANTWRLNNTFQPISISQLERGDIIYYSGHVVIYLGNGRILESTPYASNVRESSMYSPGTILGCARPFTK